MNWHRMNELFKRYREAPTLDQERCIRGACAPASLKFCCAGYMTKRSARFRDHACIDFFELVENPLDYVRLIPEQFVRPARMDIAERRIVGQCWWRLVFRFREYPLEDFPPFASRHRPNAVTSPTASPASMRLSTRPSHRADFPARASWQRPCTDRFCSPRSAAWIGH